MVTQTPPRRDPRAQSAAAQAAFRAELAALREELAWDENDVMELEDASEHLNKTGFYDNWTQDYYEGTVKKRQSYRRLYYGRNEKKSK